MFRFTQVLLSTVLMLSSFGPVLALSNLSNNLLITLASARRVLALLDEEETTKDITGKEEAEFDSIHAQNVSFAYQDEEVVRNFSDVFEKGKLQVFLGKAVVENQLY